MGLSLMTYSLLALSGGALRYTRHGDRPFVLTGYDRLHYLLGSTLVGLVLLLLAIGIVGTLGEYGRLGHSVHLPAGLTVVALILASAWSASRISPERPWARKVHLRLNGILLLALVIVTATGWSVVQKYL